MAFMDVKTKLCNQRIGRCKLGQGKARDCKLTDADQPDTELRQRKDTAGELADGEDPPGRNRPSVWPVFERNVQPGKPEKCRLGFIFKSPAIPLLFCRIRRPALRTEHCLLGDGMFAFSTCFDHLLAFCLEDHREIRRFFPSGPTNNARGNVKIIAERIHHREMESCRLRAENPNPIVTNAKIAEMSAIDSAINPRFAQPKTITGVK
jgi:hypothetical protein